ncbi:peptide methionine sulfoxide reductase msrA/msrB [Tahibacter aquaticus]|uniref:Peptide methionine sulfoxide reductase MsrA n=2 Tax=Tahibacter aquaticus TaxID=520092 RepID=A0A4R6YRM5_9GAMM|nr:peptide methionine sulfoxide reductase msrA/msrB [Tahibacter aquaticus]
MPLVRHLRRAVLSVFACLALAACMAESSATLPAKLPAASGPVDTIVLGMGCFWGAEKRMSALAGVVDVESGYANGSIPATYKAVLEHEQALQRGKATGRNHAEVIKVSFDTAQVTLEDVLIRFWESHDPTQGDRQGNDVGSNYRSAIYTDSDAQQTIALATRDAYQKALAAQGLGTISTEIAPLQTYGAAEDYHQDYLQKNPNGYCGLGGTGVVYPRQAGAGTSPMPAHPVAVATALDASSLDANRQLVVFESNECPYCEQFKRDVLDHWKSPVPVARSLSPDAPQGWSLQKAVFATPTIVLFEHGKEVSRYTGYSGEQERFWKWLGFRLLTPEQQKIAFEQGTERPFTGSNLDEKRAGTFVDPVTGVALFRSDSKFDSGTGWPSFFNPLEGAVTLHEDESAGMKRVEVRSASSGIHLGHVFDDGPPPTYKRYCINGNVLKFVPDPGA